jgi:Zn-dependent protease/predicted transcriptional regulator
MGVWQTCSFDFAQINGCFSVIYSGDCKMFGKRIHLFKLFGFNVGIDITWFILAVFITWSLAKGLFPYYFKGFSNATYWWMGVGGALGLFFSIVFHEFCHSIVARKFGLPMKGITLFIFGGVAEMENEPSSPKVEFLMAIAGPISSVLLGLGFYLVYRAGVYAGGHTPVGSVLQYLAWLNFILAGFNLFPAFPLDGGRVLRSILWAARGNLRWATKIASALGSAFGLFLIIFGIVNFFEGNVLGGVWYFLIGIFIHSASQTSYKQMLIRRALEGERVNQFMKSEVVAVPASVSIQELVTNYFYKHHFKMFPVSNDGHIVGCVTTQQVKEIPIDDWERHTVGELAQPCSDDNTISPQTDAMQALAIMNRTGNSRLIVMDSGQLVGLITLKDMLKFLALKIDLEGGSS